MFKKGVANIIAKINIEEVKGYIHKTESFGAVDGPGIRFVFFLQGCPLRCIYCHNPDALACKGGEVWTAKQAVDEVLRYKHFIKKGGVTFSGGEPLIQAEFVAACAELLHRKGIHVAIDTSGIASLENSEVKNAIDKSDLVLLDIKALDEEMAVRISGQANTNALAMLDYCEKIGKPTWIRHVLLKGYTLDDNKLRELAEYLKNYSCIEKIELLPFHKLGEPKWDEVDFKYTLANTPATTKEEVDHAAEFFKNAGINVN